MVCGLDHSGSQPFNYSLDIQQQCHNNFVSQPASVYMIILWMPSVSMAITQCHDCTIMYISIIA